MALKRLPLLSRWPAAKQLASGDHRGLDGAAMSPRSTGLRPRTERADRVVRSKS